MRLVKYLVILVVLAGVSAGGYFGYRSSALKLQRVEVIGNENVTADDIVDASTLTNGVHLLRLSTGSVARKVKTISWVMSARVERILPSKVRIVITERQPRAMVSIGGTAYLVDREGVVLQEGQRSLPLIVGLGVSSTEPGARLSAVQLDHVFRIIDALDADVRSQTRSIEAASIDRITLILDSGTRILFGAAEDLEDKNFAVQSLLRRYRLENKHIERLDVRVPLRPAVKLK